MPTEFKPGKTESYSQNSVVDILSNSSSPAIDRNNVSPNIDKFTNPIPKRRRTFFGTIGAIFTSDLLWISVAIIAIFATLLFYFQVLQPLILQKYIDTAKAQIIESNNKYNIQSGQFLSLQKEIRTNLDVVSSDICTEEAKYTKSAKDQKNVQSLKNLLTIENKLKELPDFYVFSDSETKTIYANFIADYNNALSQLAPSVDQTRQAVEFADFKNSWIDTCISIKNSKGDTKELQAICQSSLNKSLFYQKNGSKNIIDSLKKSIDSTSLLCSDIQTSQTQYYPDYPQFQLQWLNNFSTIMSLTIIPDKSATENIAKTFQSSVVSSQNKLSESFNRRIEFTNIWYLLEINLR